MKRYKYKSGHSENNPIKDGKSVDMEENNLKTLDYDYRKKDNNIFGAYIKSTISSHPEYIEDNTSYEETPQYLYYKCVDGSKINKKNLSHYINWKNVDDSVNFRKFISEEMDKKKKNKDSEESIDEKNKKEMELFVKTYTDNPENYPLQDKEDKEKKKPKDKKNIWRVLISVVCVAALSTSVTTLVCFEKFKNNVKVLTPQNAVRLQPNDEESEDIYVVSPELLTGNGIVMTADTTTSKNDVVIYNPPDTTTTRVYLNQTTTKSSSETTTYVNKKSQKAAAQTAARTTAATTAAVQYPININTATVDELKQINGIGDKKAQAIVNYRETYGKFDDVYDLALVDGIGDKTVENLLPYICV